MLKICNFKIFQPYNLSDEPFSSTRHLKDFFHSDQTTDVQQIIVIVKLYSCNQ